MLCFFMFRKLLHVSIFAIFCFMCFFLFSICICSDIGGLLFGKLFKGGHPNSLGITLEVVDAVLGNTDKMVDLFLLLSISRHTGLEFVTLNLTNHSI